MHVECLIKQASNPWSYDIYSEVYIVTPKQRSPRILADLKYFQDRVMLY